ncbi:MAG: dihydroorotate dehydrogenase-like protein [Opitutus sp.]
MNLATDYLGLELSSPFIVGASPFCDHVDGARRLQDAGASAVVMRSLFGEQISDVTRSSRTQPIHLSGAGGWSTYAEYQFSPKEYLRQLERLKRALSIPVIASLNGHHIGGWIDFAKKLQSAGADAIELNLYQVVTDPAVAADQIETEIIRIVGELGAIVTIPVAAKLSPFHTSVAQLAVALELAGAGGMVLFNRFYQPDINIDDLEVQPWLRLSETGELLLRLRWLAILSPLLRGSLCANGGVHTGEGVIKAILTGAHAVQLVSILLKHGPLALGSLRDGLEHWMREHGYVDLSQFRGLLNHERCSDPSAFERANYVRALQSWKM